MLTAEPNHCVERTGGSLHARFNSGARVPLPPVAHAGVRQQSLSNQPALESMGKAT